MYAARASQFAKTITMACSVQKQQQQQQQQQHHSSHPAAHSPPASAVATVPQTPKPKPLPGGGGSGQRASLPTDVHCPPLEFQWPPVVPVVSTHTSQLRLNMMNQDPKDLHTARLMIEELRAKVRYQTEHILKWRKAYAMQVQQHFRYQKEKTDQMNALTAQLLLLESRLKRKQKQIASLLTHRELTIQRQQKIIDTLSGRLVDHGLETIEASYAATELDSLNDSDSAVVLEEIDSDSNIMTLGCGARRKSGGGGGNCAGSGSGTDGITIVRSISDAIETNMNKYGGARRNNCFLRRPDILETVYSVEEDPEPPTDVAEKRDKFKNRSEKALSSSSTEGQIDNAPPNSSTAQEKTKEAAGAVTPSPHRQLSPRTPTKDGYTAVCVRVPQLQTTAASVDDGVDGVSPMAQMFTTPERGVSGGAKSQVTNYNRVMSNHRSVTKPKDVKYKRINKAKSKSLEELRGRLKNIVERGGGGAGGIDAGVVGGGYTPNVMPQTAQSYA